MSNFDRAVKTLNGADEVFGSRAGMRWYVTALEAAGLLMTDVQVIRTAEELEALARDDSDAVVLASEAGAVRTVRALAAMHRLGSVWGLPAVVVATGAQVRAAREAMEEENE